jgi:hypothetical protein
MAKFDDQVLIGISPQTNQAGLGKSRLLGHADRQTLCGAHTCVLTYCRHTVKSSKGDKADSSVALDMA